MRAFVALGSNIDPRSNLGSAVAKLARRFTVLGVSPVYRTVPVGDTDQADFWNLAVEIETAECPAAVHDALREIEALIGRRRDPARPFGPRTADLDLVLVDGVKGRFGALELPSPLIERASFVAVPLADLAPELCPPGLSLTLHDLALAAVAGDERPPRRLDVELRP
ncbi:MAG: 2-amino-4-hydroxy-6-hydroxymethyldihydropteridine diphosphokinase [Thermoanaerobaculaceae bacterium]|jgi:2-amino-4-hydroxy-6-hydroxymethyldihydropteridine diphosphokinase